jgi:hypothetical protein
VFRIKFCKVPNSTASELHYKLEYNGVEYSIIKFKEEYELLYDELWEIMPFEDDVKRGKTLQDIFGLLDLDLNEIKQNFPEEFL